MVELSAARAASAMAGRVIAGDPDSVWDGAAIDSRRINGREIFFALPGERVDGHDYVQRAVERGAAAVVVHRRVETMPRDANGPACILVDDTYRALHGLTRAVRERVPEQLVGITGSAGKTTTKELLAAMLGEKFRTARSPGNLNNLYGFPLSLLNIADDCEWMVAEMGMSTPGELGQVSRLGRPDAAVFTNVRPAHLENFRHLRDIADAKSELLSGLVAGGWVVANADDSEVMYIVEQHQAGHPDSRIVLYGMERSRTADEPVPDYLASEPQALPGTGYRFTLRTPDDEVEVELPLHGLYNVENCLAAAACAHSLGVSLAEIARAVTALEPSHMRGVVHRLGGVTVVDDSYNSNPDAASRALASARRLGGERYVAILGSMLELGPKTPSFHQMVGQRAAELGFQHVVGVGDLARDIVAAAAEGGCETSWHEDAAAVTTWARKAVASGEVRAGDVVLVKGSRGVGLEVVVQALVDGLAPEVES